MRTFSFQNKETGGIYDSEWIVVLTKHFWRFGNMWRVTGKDSPNLYHKMKGRDKLNSNKE